MRKALFFAVLFLVLFGPAVPVPVVYAGTFTVTTTADTGAGSLRDAITAANANVDADVIDFDIPGPGPHVIQPASALPTVTRPVVIDGTTEPDFASCAAGPVVEIDGSLAGSTHGLALSSASTVRGLAINRFAVSGQAGVFVNNANALVECSLLGTDTTGTVDRGNYMGLLLGAAATIGGSGTASNLISGNTVGIYVTASGANARILGNRIGTDITGTLDLGNSFEGIFVDGAASLQIGSSTAGEGNLISGNNTFGIRMTGGSSTIRGNRIGVAATGFSALGNGSDGISIPNIGSNDNHTIGGTGTGEGNVIAFNGGAGVFVQDRINNRILGNSIDSNGSLGINLGSGPLTPNDPGDVDSGPNNYQNFPVLTSAETNGATTAIVGTLDSNSSAAGIAYRLEFFSSPACDSLGHGEGRLFLGAHDVTTDAAGHAAFSVSVAASTVGHVLTTTATDPSGNTSEFSACRTIAAAPAPPDDCELSLGNSLAEISPPSRVDPDAYESNTQLSIFREQQGLRLTGSRSVDMLDPGCYTTSSSTGGSIPPNTVVDSYLIHGDNLGSGVVTLEGTWVFDSDVLGIIVSEQLLDFSDPTHGWPYTTYPDAAATTGRGTTVIGGDAAGEWVELDANRRTLRLRMQFDAHLDQVRVLTAGTLRPDITVDDVTVTEGNSGTSDATLTVSLSAASADPVKVSYRTRDFTATSPADFTALGGSPLPTLTFAPGETSKTVSISIVGDTIDEPNEVIEFELSKAGNATITKPIGTVTITDDDEPGPPPDDCELTLPNSLVLVDPPANVSPNAYESDTQLRIFPEQQGYTLGANLAADILAAGCYMTTGMSGPILAGSIVDSYLIHGDNLDNDIITLEGSYTFPDDILGVIVSVAGLDASDEVVGWPYTTYPGNAFGRGSTAVGGDAADDWIEIDPDGRTMRVHLAFNAYLDQIRVITVGTAAPTLSIDDVTVAEGDSGTTNAVFTVSLSAVSSHTVKVTYTTHEVTADAPTDYVGATGVLTFAPGETEKTVSVAVNGDVMDEADETYTVDLTKAGNASISDGSGLGTITDDDAPPPSDCTPGTNALVQVDAPPNVRIGQRTSNSQVIIFGEQHGYTLIAPLAVDITGPGCYSDVGSPGTIPAGTVVTSHLIHGDSTSGLVELNGTWEFTEQILGVIVSVGNLDDSDFVVGWPYTFYPIADTATFRGTSPIGGDNVGDWIETDPDGRTLRLRMEFDAHLDQVRVITAATPAPTLSIDDVSVTEGHTGTTDAVFTVSLSEASVYPVMVTFTTHDGTAESPDDFGATTGVLTFSPGETEKTVTVQVEGDLIDESDESYTIELTRAGNASINDGSGLGTILDDDSTTPPTCDFGDDVLVMVDAPAGVLHGQRPSDTELIIFGEQHGFELPVDLDVDIVDPGCYITTGDPGTIPAGTVVDSHLIHGDNITPQIITLDGEWTFDSDILGVIVTGDLLDDSDDLTPDPSAYALGWPYTVYPTGFQNRGMTALEFSEPTDWVEIDEDRRTLRLRMSFNQALDQVRVITASTPAPELSIDDVTVTEGDSGTTDAVFTVSLSTASPYTVKVSFSTADGSAAAPSDYGADSGVLTFDPGQTQKTVTIAVQGDLIDESDETYTVELSLAGNATIVDGSGLGAILDDDDAGRIVVRKHTDPDELAVLFHFDASFDGDGFFLADGESLNSGPLSAGSYSVSEDVPEGWDLTSASCSSSFGGDPFAPSGIELEGDEVVTCDFTNTQRGKIIVSKTTNPAGSTVPFAFSASYDGDGFSLSHGESNDSGWLIPGGYSVSEQVPADWDLESATCSGEVSPASISLDPGEIVQCTFVNQHELPPAAGKIVVVKETLPATSTQEFEFTSSYSPPFSLGNGDQHDSGDLAPGTYSVSESSEVGWDLTGVSCPGETGPDSIVLSAGETVTCTFTNAQRGRIIVDKVVQGLSGDATSFPFQLTGGPAAVNQSFSLTDAALPYNSGLVRPGTYSVTEQVPQYWSLLSATCSDGSPVSAVVLSANETVTCTFTNEPHPVDVRVVKSPSASTVLFGATFTYTINVTNQGPGLARNVILTDDLVNALEVSSPLPAACTVGSGDVVSCALGNLAPGDARVLAIPVRAGFDCTIFGGPGRDTLNGTSGPDIICGGGEVDTIDGGGGDDFILGCGRTGSVTNRASVSTSTFDTNLTNNQSAIVVVNVTDPSDRRDTLDGEGGDDVIHGCEGDDTIYGKSGDDLLVGHTGSDTIYGGSGNDRLFGFEQGDHLVGGDGNDELNGGAGDDDLDGNDGEDQLYGADDDDDLAGGKDDDRLDGGSGKNKLNGGTGHDFCSFGPPGEKRTSCEDP